MYTAIEAKYDRKAKAYGVEVVAGADLILCHHGYLVFEDAAFAVAGIESGRLVASWKPEHRSAVLAHLKNVASD